MAQPLTWRAVAAPNLGSPQDSINSAAKLIAASTGGLSGALTQFGDQQTLQQLAAYSDAQKLQEALQSGQFNTANASPEALKTIQSRAGELITNAGNQQNNSYDALMNPQKLAYQGVLTNQAEFNLGQDQYAQDRLKDVTNPRIDDAFARAEENRRGQEKLTQELASAYTGGALTGEGDAERMYSAAVARGESPDYLTNLLGRLQQFAPNVGKPIGSLVPGVESSGAVNAASRISTVNPEIGKLLTGADSTFKLPAGMMEAILQKETGGKQTYLNDPAKYHYPLNAEGKRVSPVTGKVSTAFGPYGILESTAKDPGFGVAPLKDKSLPEQTRFASEYLAARIKAAGGDVAKGLAGYGEGAEYSADVLARLQTLPSKAENALSQQSAVDANTLANASSGSSDAQRLLSVAAESQGKDNSLASVTASLVGKGGVLGNVSPTNVEESLSKVVNALGVNATVAAELVKQAGGSTDREFNLFGAGPIGMQGSVNAERLDALIAQYKKPGQLLNSLRTGAVYAQNATAVTDAAAKQKKYDDQVRDLTLLADAGKPGAAEALRVAEEKQLAARLASRDTSQATANAATANLPIDAPPPKKADKPPSASKAAKLIAENAPLRSIDGGKTWQLSITPTVRDPSVKYYREIPNPIFVALNNKSFGSRAEAERAYKEALAQKS